MRLWVFLVVYMACVFGSEGNRTEHSSLIDSKQVNQLEDNITNATHHAEILQVKTTVHPDHILSIGTPLRAVSSPRSGVSCGTLFAVGATLHLLSVEGKQIAEPTPLQSRSCGKVHFSSDGATAIMPCGAAMLQAIDAVHSPPVLAEWGRHLSDTVLAVSLRSDIVYIVTTSGMLETYSLHRGTPLERLGVIQLGMQPVAMAAVNGYVFVANEVGVITAVDVNRAELPAPLAPKETGHHFVSLGATEAFIVGITSSGVLVALSTPFLREAASVATRGGALVVIDNHVFLLRDDVVDVFFIADGIVPVVQFIVSGATAVEKGPNKRLYVTTSRGDIAVFTADWVAPYNCGESDSGANGSQSRRRLAGLFGVVCSLCCALLWLYRRECGEPRNELSVVLGLDVDVGMSADVVIGVDEEGMLCVPTVPEG